MEKPKICRVISSSFRDPSGFLFFRDGSMYRQINHCYKEDYDHLMRSGLYTDLVDNGLLIPHDEVDVEPERSDKSYRVIKPEEVSFISYPYEWCFGQLKDAAMTTLKIQKKALDFAMSLKDCSAYNIQFRKGRAIFIDTLSFEKYRKGQPWVAYRQFCQHFLAPLALMSYNDIRLNQLLRIFIDGVPLDLASRLLRFRTYFTFSLLSHIHLNARSQRYFARKEVRMTDRTMSLLSLCGFIDSLESAVRGLGWKAEGTEWADYYEDTNYSADALKHKRQIVSDFLDEERPKSVWDLGANVGLFSRIASDRGIETVSFDADPSAVEKNYRECAQKGETGILPLLLDLTNPSPGVGWQNQERMSFFERGPADMVFALALIHHLAISSNLSFNKIAEFFSRICRDLIIEFVPKNDFQVQRLLSTREDIFFDYTKDFFESEFKRFFSIKRSVRVKDSERVIYLMRKTGV